MARVFSLPTVLRQVPKPLLGRFFAGLGVAFPGLDWATLGERDVQSMLTVLNGLPNAEMVPVENELRTVFEMACDAGLNALIETAAALGDHDLAGRMPQDQTAYGRAMWTWLEHRDYFIQAGLMFQVDQLSWWRKRNDLPTRPPKASPEDRDGLRREISHLLLTEQGRGRLCSVEVLERGPTTYFFAYPDDFVQSVQEHDAEGRLAPRAVRRTFSIVFAYGRDEGTLELFAKVPGKLKPRLEELFARHVLDAELGAWQPPAAFALNHLRLRSTSLPVDPADAVTVWVKRLRFEVPGSKRRIELEADPEGGPRDIHAMIAEYFDRDALRVEDLRVKSATLVFTFAELGDRKPGTATVDIGHPSSCNLRHQRPERVEVIQKYLKQWGIDVRPGDSRPAAPRRHGAAAVA